MKRVALFAVALIGMAGVAQAQSSPHTSNPAPYHQQAQEYQSGGNCGHQVSITDEYGFKYDGMGNRLNARGCVIAPPHTLPGAKAIKG